jgi:hypothetical protein
VYFLYIGATDLRRLIFHPYKAQEPEGSLELTASVRDYNAVKAVSYILYIENFMGCRRTCPLVGYKFT